MRRFIQKMYKKPPKCVFNPRAGILNPKENWEEIHRLIHHNAERISALEGKMVVILGVLFLVVGLTIGQFFIG